MSSASTRYTHRDDAFSAAHCLECASPKWMNLRTWIAWKFDTTDWPTDQPPMYPGPSTTGGRAGGLDDPTHLHARPRWSTQGTRVLDREADWSTAPVKGHFDEFHNQWLTHWHSYQIADSFNRRNITSINCPKLHFASSVLRFYGLEIFVVEFVL